MTRTLPRAKSSFGLGQSCFRQRRRTTADAPNGRRARCHGGTGLQGGYCHGDGLAGVERDDLGRVTDCTRDGVGRDRVWPALLPRRWLSYQIQLQQPLQCLFFAEIRRPAVSIRYSIVEALMGLAQPGRPLIVEVRQGTLLQFLVGFFVDGNNAIRETWDDFRLHTDQLGWVQPVLPEFIQPYSSICDTNRTWVGCVVGSLDVRSQPLWKRKGLEG